MCQHWMINSATAGVCSLGLYNTVFPARRAGTMCPLLKWAGKLNAPNTTTTPCGLKRRQALASAVSVCFGHVLS
ncbi:Uncharacterised protein [Legionella pneumophila]|nr:Uncharacterised protein [Legionella pneumophila]